MSQPPLRQAATIIVARQRDTHVEVFMVKRHGKSSFMPDVHVYPGGALDPQDCAPDAQDIITGMSDDEARARLGEELSPHDARGLFLAGVRETFEEAGFLLARRQGSPDWIDLTSDADIATRFADHRQRLRAGEISLTKVLRDEALTVPLDHLGYFAHWITPYIESKRFDARFFVTLAPELQEPLHDSVEITSSTWVSPQRALEAYRGGEISLAPPTLSTLLRLSAFQTVDALLAHARTHRPATTLPHFEAIDAQMNLLLPHDPDFPRDDERYEGATGGTPWTRMVLDDGLWTIDGHFERGR